MSLYRFWQLRIASAIGAAVLAIVAAWLGVRHVWDPTFAVVAAVLMAAYAFVLAPKGRLPPEALP